MTLYSLLESSCLEIPSIRDTSGICPAMKRLNSAGMILRFARSPVAPNTTKSKGCTGIVLETILKTFYKFAITLAVSIILLEKPHSLSYQETTLTKPPLVTVVCGCA